MVALGIDGTAAGSGVAKFRIVLGDVAGDGGFRVGQRDLVALAFLLRNGCFGLAFAGFDGLLDPVVEAAVVRLAVWLFVKFFKLVPALEKGLPQEPEGVGGESDVFGRPDQVSVFLAEHRHDHHPDIEVGLQEREDEEVGGVERFG